MARKLVSRKEPLVTGWPIMRRRATETWSRTTRADGLPGHCCRRPTVKRTRLARCTVAPTWRPEAITRGQGSADPRLTGDRGRPSSGAISSSIRARRIQDCRPLTRPRRPICPLPSRSTYSLVVTQLVTSGSDQAAALPAPPALSRTRFAACSAAYRLENDSPDAATLSELRHARHRHEPPASW